MGDWWNGKLGNHSIPSQHLHLQNKAQSNTSLHGGQAGLGAIQRNLVSQHATTFSVQHLRNLHAFKTLIRLHSMISVTLLAVKKKYKPGCHQPLFRQNKARTKDSTEPLDGHHRDPILSRPACASNVSQVYCTVSCHDQSRW